jgi:hypothetical protein
MLAVPIGQIAAVSAGYGPVTIAGQGQMSIAIALALRAQASREVGTCRRSHRRSVTVSRAIPPGYSKVKTDPSPDGLANRQRSERW